MQLPAPEAAYRPSQQHERQDADQPRAALKVRASQHEPPGCLAQRRETLSASQARSRQARGLREARRYSQTPARPALRPRSTRTVGPQTDLAGEKDQLGTRWNNGRVAVGRARLVHGFRVKKSDHVSRPSGVGKEVWQVAPHVRAVRPRSRWAARHFSGNKIPIQVRCWRLAPRRHPPHPSP